MIGVSLVILTACGNKDTNTSVATSISPESNNQSVEANDIKEYEETNDQVMNFTDSVQVPTEFNPKQVSLIYESEKYKVYDETDFGYIQNLDEVKYQSFEFVVECLDETSCDLTNKSFSYKVGDDLYYSTQLTTTGQGFLNNKNYQFVTFEVTIPAGENLDAIYFNQENMTELTSDNITAKIDATNSAEASSNSEGSESSITTSTSTGGYVS